MPTFGLQVAFSDLWLLEFLRILSFLSPPFHYYREQTVP